jgi:ubiquinone/menaquinone biosynthesis C-methylase UbiE
MGRRVFGVDASRGMLAVARAKHPEVETRMADLTTLALPESYRAVMCVDALENLPPERWPGALRRLARATRPAGWLYVTVERTTPEEAEAAYRSGRARGEPLVRGEDTRAGYHYYPSEERVRDWMRRAGLVVVREERDAPTHGEYWHLLCRPAKTRRRAVAARTRPRREERRPLR